MQPRPPRTSSAGKIRRPTRVKSAGKKTSGENVDEKECDVLEREKKSSVRKSQAEINGNLPENSDFSKASELNTSSASEVRTEINSSSKTQVASKENMLDIKAWKYGDKAKQSSISDKLTAINSLENPTENDPISETDRKESLLYKSDVKSSYKDTTENSEEKVNEQHISDAKSNCTSNGTSALVNKSTTEQLPRGIISDDGAKSTDINNNDTLIDKDEDQPRIRPRKLPLASNNPVFTFASMPRSPRSGKRKLLESPMVDDAFIPRVEVPPEVMVSLADDAMLKDPEKSGGQRNRGVSLEDDFCKLPGQ